MIKSRTEDVVKLPIWLIKFCKWLWKIRSFVWGTIILNIILGIGVTLVFTDPSTLIKLPIGWIFLHPFAVLTIFVIFFSFTCISGLISYLAIPLSHKSVRKLYFKHTIRNNYELATANLLSPRNAPNVKITEVFISINLWSNRATVGQPLSERELIAYRQMINSENFREGLDTIVADAGKNWLRTHNEQDRITIKDLWKGLTKENPVAVIQGFAGMGKSTLLKRLAVYMAQRGLHIKDELELGSQKNEVTFCYCRNWVSHMRTLYMKFALL